MLQLRRQELFQWENCKQPSDCAEECSDATEAFLAIADLVIAQTVCSRCPCNNIFTINMCVYNVLIMPAGGRHPHGIKKQLGTCCPQHGQVTSPSIDTKRRVSS